MRDASGNETRFDYDPAGRMVKVTDALGNVNRTEYDLLGRITARIDAKGNRTSYEFDAAGRLVSVTAPDGGVTSLGYCADVSSSCSGCSGGSAGSQSKACAIIDPLGNLTLVDYDEAGRPLKITDPEGHVSETVYDLLGRKIQSADPTGKSTSYDYTDSGRLWKVTDALGGITEYGYDLRGNRTLVRDANGHETSFEFDMMDRLIRETNPLGHVTAFTYAADGARLTKLDPKGQLIEYFHDSNRRLTDILYPDGSGTHFAFDERGNKIYEDNGTTSRSYAHDALNRVVQVTDFELGKSITYEYEPGGQRSKLIGPEGEETVYLYDVANRIRELVDPDGGRYVFGYDAAGRRTSLSFPNGVQAAYFYDQASRLVNMVYKNSAGDVLSSFAYTHDAAGNRLSKTLASGGVESYGYDLLHRLVNASYPTGRQVSYDYDPVGNRNFVQETSSGGSTETTTYTYSEFNQVLSTSNGAGVTTYGWDDNGNLAAKLSPSGALTQYQYNYENRLSSILYAGGAVNQFGYDTQGIRTMKQDSEGLQRYLIDQVSVLADYDALGTQTARYTLNPQRIDEMLGQHQAQGKFYHLVDGLGSVYGLTNEAGVKVASYGYDAYGATSEAQVPTGLSNRWMFTGREMDGDSGLQYNRARYYLSGVGSWIRRDPLFSNAGESLYSYTQGIPTRFGDPLGLFEWGYGVAPKSTWKAVSSDSHIKQFTAGIYIAYLWMFSKRCCHEAMGCNRYGQTFDSFWATIMFRYMRVWEHKETKSTAGEAYPWWAHYDPERGELEWDDPDTPYDGTPAYDVAISPYALTWLNEKKIRDANLVGANENPKELASQYGVAKTVVHELSHHWMQAGHEDFSRVDLILRAAKICSGISD